MFFVSLGLGEGTHGHTRNPTNDLGPMRPPCEVKPQTEAIWPVNTSCAHLTGPLELLFLARGLSLHLLKDGSIFAFPLALNRFRYWTFFSPGTLSQWKWALKRLDFATFASPGGLRETDMRGPFPQIRGSDSELTDLDRKRWN